MEHPVIVFPLEMLELTIALDKMLLIEFKPAVVGIAIWEFGFDDRGSFD